MFGVGGGYGWGDTVYGRGTPIGRWVHSDTGSAYQFFIKNNLGSTVRVVSAEGAFATRPVFDYQAYGELQSMREDSLNPVLQKFTGKGLDTEVNLYYFGARWYDQELGMWISPDPAAQFFNPYSYVGGDVTGAVDPDGRESAPIEGDADKSIVIDGISSIGRYTGSDSHNAPIYFITPDYSEPTPIRLPTRVLYVPRAKNSQDLPNRSKPAHGENACFGASCYTDAPILVDEPSLRQHHSVNLALMDARSASVAGPGVHTALDLAGFTPVIGPVFDLLNAALYLSEGNYRMAAFSSFAAVPLLGDFASVGRLGVTATRGGAQLARELGTVGEDAVRAAYNIGTKQAIDVGGRLRIPDGLTSTTLSEVKNVRSLSFTHQLRDYSSFAQQNGLRFDIYIRGNTYLSAPLVKAAEQGLINIRTIPGY